MWRERLHQSPSNAEDQLTCRLSTRKLLRHMEIEGTTLLFYSDHIAFVHKDKVTHEMVEESEGYTLPDRLMKREYGIYPIYLDGPPHKQDGIRRRDEWVNSTLRAYGVEPWRYPHTGTLPKYLLKEICDRIETVLNGVTS